MTVVELAAGEAQFPELLPARSEVHVRYSPELADVILEQYINGKSLREITEQPGMPAYSTLLKWVKDSQKFAGEFERARQARALDLEDRVLAIASEGPYGDKEVPGKRLEFDVLKWGAEAGDPQRFGKKVTIGGDVDRPIVFKVVTGVPEPTEDQLGVELNSDGTRKDSNQALEAPLGT